MQQLNNLGFTGIAIAAAYQYPLWALHEAEDLWKCTALKMHCTTF
jgi:hypothetical protein